MDETHPSQSGDSMEAPEGGVEELASAAATWILTALTMMETRASTDIPELEEVTVAQLVGGGLESDDAEVLPDVSELNPYTPDEVGREPMGGDREDITQNSNYSLKPADRNAANGPNPAHMWTI